MMMGTPRPFFDAQDTETARRYVENSYQPGAFDPIIGGSGSEDAVATACIASARHYMSQSQSVSSSAGMEFRLYPAMINTLVPNAFAAEHDGLHVCGLHVGLFAMIQEICFLSMAQQNVFTEVGNAEGENSPRYSDDQAAAFWLHDHTIAKTDVSQHQFANEIVPNCPSRYFFAIHLILMMLRTVWLHETAHCLNGHVGYLKSLKQDIRLNEVADIQLTPIIHEAG